MSLFTTNCTIPPVITTFVTSPNARGTWDILWAALSTLFLCTWSIQHPNLPSIDTTSNAIKVKVVRLLKRLALMLGTLVVPEFLLLKAIGDFESAKALGKQMIWRANRELVEWSIVHSYFLNMGGFVVVFDETLEEAAKNEKPPPSLPRISLGSTDLEAVPAISGSIEEGQDIEGPLLDSTTRTDIEGGNIAPRSSEPEQPLLNSVTISKKEKPDPVSKAKEVLTTHQKKLYHLVHVREKHLPISNDPNTALVRSAINIMKDNITSGAYNSHGFVRVNNTAINLVRLRGNRWALDGAQFIYARENGFVAAIPDMKREEIEEKSKTDSLAKFLACVTVGWTVVQLLIRWAKRLPASQLEVVVVAYAFLTFFIYAMNWNKPQDIETPCFVSALRYPTAEELIALAELGPDYIAGAFPGFDYGTPEHALHSNFEAIDGKDGGVFSWLGGMAGGLVFGALHCAAWNFNFPTPVESLLWKIASLITTGIPVLYVARTALMDVLEKGTRQRWPIIEDTVVPYLGIVVTCVYTLSRCFLLVETFRSLLYLVPSAFQL